MRSGVPVRSLYGYVWQASRRAQFLVCVLTTIIAPLPMAYLELQRRTVDEAITERNLRLLHERIRKAESQYRRYLPTLTEQRW